MRTMPQRLFAFLMIGTFLLSPWRTATAQEPQPGGGLPAPMVASATNIGGLYNTNLVPDGGAEMDYTTDWKDNEGFTQIKLYGADCGGMCDFPTPYDPGPALRGKSFFYMGTTPIDPAHGTNMWIKNKISLSAIQSAINTGKVRYILSGYFGGEVNNPNTAQFHMFFETGTGGNKGEVIVGNVTPQDRQNKTGLLYRQQTGFIPAGTQNINLLLQSGYFAPASAFRTGYADNLSLVLIPLKEYIPLIRGAKATKAPVKTGFPAPSNVFVMPNGLTRMDIFWSDNSTNELGFEVQRVNPDSSVDTICNTKPNVNYCLDPGFSQSALYGYVYLGSHVTYTYQVRAVGEGINSAWANGSGTTATEPNSPPTATGGAFTCQAIEVTSSSATFVWNNPFNYEAGFNLYINSELQPRYSVIENGTKITFINQNPGTITLKIVPFVYDRNDPGNVYQSSTTCTATAELPSPTPSGISYFHNDASYPVISLVVDGWEQFPVRPLAMLSGSYYELDEVPTGQHTWTAITGFWDDLGQRFSMYDYTGSFVQPASGSYDIHIPDMTIQDLLTIPPGNLGYWEGYYFDAYGNCFTTAFKFKQNGTFTFYNANSQVDSGTFSLVKREPDIFSAKFHVTSSNQNVDGLLIETHGTFFMKNGPATWNQITYVFKPQGYVRNPFCP